jgi:prenyltransferase beta subunit
MKFAGRCWLLFTACVLAANTTAAEDEAERGANWILAQQAEDGGWHSSTYGSMQSGVGNTALVLDALSHMPAEWRAAHAAAISRGVRFLLANLDDSGYLTAPRRSADFPTYATALLLKALDRMSSREFVTELEKMRRYLREVQGSDTEANFGGWSHVGGELEDAETESNFNLSVTRHALEALTGDEAARPSRENAISFVENCRNSDDGGFYFRPTADDPLNKAGVTAAGAARSYGTTTADGILALLACQVPADDERIQGALHWLEENPTITKVPGYGGRGGVVHADTALQFYYFAALARVMERFPLSMLATRHDALRKEVIRLQQLDGSWSNPNKLMREDDPLIATAFAINALTTLDRLRETVPAK